MAAAPVAASPQHLNKLEKKMNADELVNMVLSHPKFKTVVSAAIDAQLKAKPVKEKAVSKKKTEKAVKK